MKKLNSKGFTLIELLAVIVILALLVVVAVPAVSRYLATSRKGVMYTNIMTATNAVKDDLASGAVYNAPYGLTEINALLDTKLVNSPFGSPYSSDSNITVTYTNGIASYTICIHDDAGNGYRGSLSGLTDSNQITTGVDCA